MEICSLIQSVTYPFNFFKWLWPLSIFPLVYIHMLIKLQLKLGVFWLLKHLKTNIADTTSVACDRGGGEEQRREPT